MKTIFHYGGWGRNYGDLAIQYSIQYWLNVASKIPLHFVPIDLKKSYPINSDMVDYINSQGDMLIIGGGGVLMKGDGFSSESGYQFNISRENLEKLQIPIVVYGIGWNVFKGDTLSHLAIEHLKLLQKKAVIFSVRNELTKRKLVHEGFDSEKIEVVPDAAMFVPAFTPNLRLPGGTFCLGLNWAGDRIAQRFEEGEQDRMINKVCQEIDKLFTQKIKTHNHVRLVYIPHVHYDWSDKWKFTRYFGDNFYDVTQELPWLYPEDYNGVPFFAGIYSQMDLVLGMRGHANIIPYGLGTPVVGLGDHIKIKAITEYLKTDHVGNNCKRLYEILSDSLTNTEKSLMRKDILKSAFITLADLNDRILGVMYADSFITP